LPSTKDQVLTTFPDAEKRVKNEVHGQVFLMFEAFGNVVIKTLS